MYEMFEIPMTLNRARSTSERIFMNASQQNTTDCCRHCRFSKCYGDECLCRRNAPHSGQPNNVLYVSWPTVRSDDWCGEFEPKRTAVPPWHTGDTTD